MRLLIPLSLLLAAACTQPSRREPIPVQVGEPLPPTARRAPPPAADPNELDAATEALLERLLVEPPQIEQEARAPDGPPDERPLTLLVDWELGAGPFAMAGRQVPPSALRHTLAIALARRFDAGGALRGPRRVELAELGLDAPLRSAEPLPEELPEALLAAGRELGARYLLHGRIERMDHRRGSVRLEHARRQLATERAWLAFSYQLYDLSSGELVCAQPFERSFDFEGLAPDELASAEWLLAWELARLVREDIARCLAPSPEEQDAE